MLKEIISPALRSKLYAVYAVLALVLGAVQVGFASADAGQPTWLTTTLAVFVFVGAGLGFTAQANTPAGQPKRAADPALTEEYHEATRKTGNITVAGNTKLNP